MAKREHPVGDGNGVADLFANGMVVNVRISWWRGQRKLRPADLRLNPDRVPEIFSLGRKMLIPRETVRSFHNVEARAAAWVDQYSHTLPIGGHFVPLRALPPLLDKLNELKAQFEAKAAAFLGDYSRIQEEMLRDFSRYAHALEGFYPPGPEVAARFSFEISLFEIRMPRDLRASQITQSKARRRAKRERDQAEAHVAALAEYRQGLRARMDSWLEEVAGTMRQETVRVCTSIAQTVADGKLHHQQVASLQGWLDRFSALNFLEDSAMERALSELRRQIGATATKDINSDPAALAAVGEACSAALAEAQKAAAPAAIAGRYRRKVRIAHEVS